MLDESWMVVDEYNPYMDKMDVRSFKLGQCEILKNSNLALGVIIKCQTTIDKFDIHFVFG